MKKLFFRRVCLFLLALVTFVLGAVILMGAISGIQNEESFFKILLRFGPSLIHLALSFALALVLWHYQHSTFGSDAQMLPLLLSLLSLADIRALPACYAAIPVISLSLIARIYQITLVAAILVSITCTFYQMEISVKRINSGALLACSLAFIVGMTAPLSPNTATFLKGAYVGASIMRLGVCLLCLAGGVACIASLFQENVYSETIVKSIAYALDIIALVILAYPYNPIRDFAAILLELGSLLMLVLLARSRRFWT